MLHFIGKVKFHEKSNLHNNFKKRKKNLFKSDIFQKLLKSNYIVLFCKLLLAIGTYFSRYS